MHSKVPKPSYFARVSYIGSAYELSQLPPDVGVEIAVAGRSNAGKSSAINVITGCKGLARTSKTPGRTQTINSFILMEDRRLVDLPGYGYARIAKSLKQHWQQILPKYLSHRRSLKGLLLVIDIRRLMTERDAMMVAYCRELALPVHILLTKADKLKSNAAREALKSMRNEFQGVTSVSVQLFSSKTRDGVAQSWQALDPWLV